MKSVGELIEDLEAENAKLKKAASRQSRSKALLDAFDRIRDAAVKAFAVSRASARRDPIGRAQAEIEFDTLFGVIQDEKRKASNARLHRTSEARHNEKG